MVAVESLSDAERRLLDAVRSGTQCDFSDGRTIRPSDMEYWGEERTIRAAVLKALLTGDGGEWGIGAGRAAAVDLRGAVVSGDLMGLDETQLPGLRMPACRFDGKARFHRVTFTGDARFSGAIFTGEAHSTGRPSTRGAPFHGAIFTGDASFRQATFTRGARFSGATFTGDHRFDGATFSGDAQFGDTTFTRDAWFDGYDLHPRRLVQQGDLHRQGPVRRGGLHRRRQVRRVLARRLGFHVCDVRGA